MKTKHFYIMFPAGLSQAQADAWLSKWGAERDAAEGPAPLLDGMLCLAVHAAQDLPQKASQLAGAVVYDNEQRAELY